MAHVWDLLDSDQYNDNWEPSCESGCILGDACLCPHFDHRSDECFTAKMAEEWAAEAEVTRACEHVNEREIAGGFLECDDCGRMVMA